MPYGDLVNSAVNFYNAQQLDSAQATVRRALMIYDGYPIAFYGHNILGNILQTNGDMPGAIASFRRAAEVSRESAKNPQTAADSSLIEDHKTAAVLTGQLMIDEGDRLEGAAKTQIMNDAVAWLQEYLKDFPGDLKAQSAMATAQLKSGDTEAANRLFGEMLSNPDKYSDINLFEAGVGAARAEQSALAAQLFEAGLKKNPYSRDGLFNLATVYSDTAAGKLEEMPAVLARLHALDPENPDNSQLSALYWQAKARQLRPAAEGKDLPDPAAVAFKVANDSLLHYYERYTGTPVKVSFNLFTHNEGTHVLAGQVDNRSQEEKSYTLKFEFLDASGAVLDTREVAVEGVRGGGNKAFRIEITDKPGVVGFRYSKLTP
jgi:tetratricopeptide (TPR) repeat protein